VNTETSRITAE